MDVFRTMIVAASDAPLARSIAATLAPAYAQGMWETPLSATGTEPATHYISSGPVGAGFAAPLPLATWAQEGDPPQWVRTSYDPGHAALVAQRCRDNDPPLEVTAAEVQHMFDASDVTIEDPWAAMGRLGLKIVTPPQPEPTPVPELTPEPPDAA